MNEAIKEINAAEDVFINAAARFKNELVSAIKKYGRIEYNPPGTPDPDYIIDRINDEPEDAVTMTVDGELIDINRVSAYISDIYVNDMVLIGNTDEYSCVAEFLRNNIKED